MTYEGGPRPRSPAIERALRWLRWFLFLPVSLGMGFVVAGTISFLYAKVTGASTGSLGYIAAFASGLAYVWVALYTAHSVAPSHKRVVAAVLGILLLGDLTFIHLVMQTDVFQRGVGFRPEESGLGMLLSLLRADDFNQLRLGGVVKVAGALMGLLFAWHTLAEKHRTELKRDA